MQTHINFSKDRPHSGSNQYYSSTLILILLASLTCLCWAEQESATIDDANAVGSLSFPYMAEITGNDVNIRSGPGTNYYRCGKLNSGDRVEVVSSQFGWSRIAPPVGCFSWISMQYVSVNLADPSVGTITGEGTCVYAGSDYVEPIHSTAEQLRLSRGDKIKLLGEEKDDYYKIAPPAGAYLWVSSNYIRPIEPDEGPLPVLPGTTDANVPEVKISIEAQKLEEFHNLQKQIETEIEKPLDEQNYKELKQALSEIADNNDAGQAARYAKFKIQQIERFELAAAVAKEVQLQDKQLQQIEQQIDKACSTRLLKVEDMGRFAVIGQFKSSSVYAEGQSKHYRIIDKSGKTICYALATGQALEMNLSEFIDKKVGLIGTIEPHPPTAKALVRFTEIVQQK
jgi:uncharacterized protein YgiM (DUF1202 family)